MPDRVVRDEILESDRWLDLPTDTDRLSFFVLVLKVDDFGNMEGHIRRIFRWLRVVTQIKTVEATATTLSHLNDADLVRSYLVEGRPFLHIPRLRPHRQYLTRKVPPSPWDDERELGKNRRIAIQGLAKSQALGEKIATTSHQRSNDVAEGVDVGVDVGVGRSTKATTRSKPTTEPAAPAWDWPIPIALWVEFRQHRIAMKAKMTEGAERRLLIKLRNYATQGHDPAAIVGQSIERGWKGFFPVDKDKVLAADDPRSGLSPAGRRTAANLQHWLERKEGEDGNEGS